MIDNVSADAILLLDPFRVKPFAGQPRKRFHGIAKLAESIRIVGQVTPIVVTACRDKGFDAELVDGERRLQACRKGKLRIRAVMHEETAGHDRFALSVAANFCRQGHDAMEIAEAVKVLKDGGRSAEEIAKIFGKSMAWVYQHAMLLDLAPQVQAAIANAANDQTRSQVRRGGRLTMGLAILMNPLSHTKQAMVAARIVKQGMSYNTAKQYIETTVAKAGHVKQRRTLVAAPVKNPFKDFQEATAEYRRALDAVAEMEYAKLKEAIADMATNRVARLADDLNEMCGNMRGVVAALKKRLDA